MVFFFMLVSMLCLAFILYATVDKENKSGENPPNNNGTTIVPENENAKNETNPDSSIAGGGASNSWWCLFIIRLGITLTLARVTEFLLIDFIVLETSLAVCCLGRLLTLMLIQAKGWPILSIYWGIWNFAMVYGKRNFAKHWFFWLSRIFDEEKLNASDGNNSHKNAKWLFWLSGIFDETRNPSGGITSGSTYTAILITMIIAGFVIMVKRLLVSLLLGKKKYGEFRQSICSCCQIVT